MTPTDLALEYATARGWSVFPCRAADEDSSDPLTGEIETRKVKTPYTSNGLKGATKNERLVKEMWRRHPQAMVGAPTGKPMGMFVVDFDSYKNPNALAELPHSLPETLTAETMSGGKHYYFKHVDGIRNSGALPNGLDVRSCGGYVIAPGSQTVDGRAYRWMNDLPAADAPEWLLALINPPVPVATPYNGQSATNDRYVDKALDAELALLASTPKGGRGEQLNKSAFAVGQFVGAGALTASEATTMLYAAADAAGLVATDSPRQVSATIRRGLDAGSAKPRDIPAPPIETPLVDIQLSVNQPPVVAVQEPVPAGALIEATEYDWPDPKTIEPRAFLYDEHYIRKYVSVTVSPGGLGKTSLSVAEAFAMTTGLALLGPRPADKLRVWLFNAEDPRDEMSRRIAATRLHYKKKPQGLFLDVGRERDLVIAREDKGATKIYEPLVDAVIATIKANKIDVMIVDPFVSTHRVNENDNNAIDMVAKKWAAIADECDCSIELVHHIRKIEGREASIDDSRGAKSLLDACRSGRALNQMSPEQAKEANLKPEDRFKYVSVTRGKANMSAKMGDKSWFTMESVPLGNGRGLNQPQDSVGVVVPWKLPSASEIAVSAPQLAEICRRLDNAQWRSDPQAKPWAGEVVADVLDMDARGDKKPLAALIERWVDDGVLRKELFKVGTKGKPHLKSGGWRRPAGLD